MNKNEMLPDDFVMVIGEATSALRKHNIEVSQSLIAKAMMIDMDAPEPHNLLGILCEMKCDDSTARKHYRAAYALDPTYKAACRNLERLVMVDCWTRKREYVYGDEPEYIVSSQSINTNSSHP